MNIVELTPDGDMYRETVLGPNILDGEVQQLVVKGGTWFGCFPADETPFSFVGCTVSPGFDFQDFELGSRARLLRDFPNASDIIIKLTVGLPWKMKSKIFILASFNIKGFSENWNIFNFNHF